MGNNNRANEIVLLFDNYSIDSQDLHRSFQMAGKDYPAVVIEEDGFLPEDVISVYGFFLGDFKNAKNIPGKPRYFNQITVPDYWEISGNNNSGKIHDSGCQPKECPTKTQKERISRATSAKNA